MKVNVISFGGKLPQRAHKGDAGADVFANEKVYIKPNSTAKVPLGIGLELPENTVAFIMPRSGLSSEYGITTEIVPIDSGYRGEIHAIVYNASGENVLVIQKGLKLAQLVILPVLTPELEFSNIIDFDTDRGNKGFGSSGDK